MVCIKVFLNFVWLEAGSNEKLQEPKEPDAQKELKPFWGISYESDVQGSAINCILCWRLGGLI